MNRHVYNYGNYSNYAYGTMDLHDSCHPALDAGSSTIKLNEMRIKIFFLSSTIFIATLFSPIAVFADHNDFHTIQQLQSQLASLQQAFAQLFAAAATPAQPSQGTGTAAQSAVPAKKAATTTVSTIPVIPATPAEPATPAQPYPVTGQPALSAQPVQSAVPAQPFQPKTSTGHAPQGYQPTGAQPEEVIRSLQAQIGEVRGRLVQQLQNNIQSLQTQVAELQSKQRVISGGQEIIQRSLRRGLSGDDVRKLQEFLAQDKDIYPQGLAIGYFGPATEAAVKKFQEKHGIEQVGIVGPKTRAKIQDFVSCGTSDQRPCYERETGGKTIRLNQIPGENAFSACVNNNSQSLRGESAQATPVCAEEMYQYCHEGQSEVVIKKFEGQCKAAPPVTEPIIVPVITPTLTPTPTALSFCDISAIRPDGFVTYDVCVDAGPRIVRRANGDLFALFTTFGTSPTYGTPLAGLRKSISKDNGVTWSTPEPAFASIEGSTGSNSLSIIENASGQLVIVGQGFSDGLHVWISSDGVSWTHKGKVAFTQPNLDYFPSLLQSKDGYYYLAYDHRDSTLVGGSNVYIARSKDLLSWETPMQISLPGGYNERPHMAQTSDGTLYVAYAAWSLTNANLISPDAGNVVILASSNGQVWTRVGKISDYAFGQNSINLLEMNGNVVIVASYWGLISTGVYGNLFAHVTLSNGSLSPITKLVSPNNALWGGDAIKMADNTIGLIYTAVNGFPPDTTGQKDIRFTNSSVPTPTPMSSPSPTPISFVITTQTLPAGAWGIPYYNVSSSGTLGSVILGATGGAAPYTWEIGGGNFPKGLTLNTTTGLISQWPLVVPGTYAFTVNVIDSTGARATKELSIEVKSDQGGYWGGNQYDSHRFVRSVRFGYDRTKFTDVRTIRLYEKKPGQTQFTLSGVFPLASTACGTSVTSDPNWTLGFSCRTDYEAWTAQSRVYDSGDTVPIGEYSYYAAVVDSAGVETAISDILHNYALSSTKILSPTLSQSPVFQPFTIQWTIPSGGWPSQWSSAVTAGYSIHVHEEVSKTQIYRTTVSVPISSQTGSKVYDGLPLDPAKMYRVNAYYSYLGIDYTNRARVNYITMTETPTTFSVNP